jgi:hypothetical protein
VLTDWDPDEPAPPHTDDDVPWDTINEWDRLEGMVRSTPTHQPATTEQLAAGPFIDWHTFWQRDRSDAEYLYDEVIVRGRGHALYALHKTGKSLFMLHAAAHIATHDTDTVVVYLDYEMTEDDLQERLEDMGYGPEHDLTKLRYWLLPTLPPLDSPAGGAALIQIIAEVAHQFPDHHIAVIIDTTGRAVTGDENDAGTYQDFYRHSGLKMKQMGVTWARLDHKGKDPTKGQRGSSAKGDDIDVAWEIVKTDNGVELKRQLSRLSWVPERAAFAMTDIPLRYVRVGEVYPQGTKLAADDLDRLGAPVDIGGNQAQQILRDAHCKHRRNVVLAAVKWRREDGRDSHAE